MSVRYNIGQNVGSLEVTDKLEPYTRVVVRAGENDDGDNILGEAGVAGGKTFEVDIPLLAAQAGHSSEIFDIANSIAAEILSRIQSYAQQPYNAKDAILSLESTLGDGVVIGDTYGIVAKQSIDFHPFTTFDISADGGDDEENEFDIKSKSRTERQIESLRRYASTIEMTSHSILAEVREQGGDLAQLRLDVNENESTIGLFVTKTYDEDGNVESRTANGSFIIQAINGESSATINANRIELNGDLVIDAINGGTGNVSINANRVNMSGVLTWNNISERPNMSDYVTDTEFSGTVSTIYTTINETSVTAEKLIGREVKLIDRVSEYGELVDHDVGSLTLTYTEDYDIGVELNADMGLKLTSGKNIFIDAGSSGSITMKNNNIIFSGMNFCIPGQGYGWGYDSPVGRVNGVNNQIYFQVVD